MVTGTDLGLSRHQVPIDDLAEPEQPAGVGPRFAALFRRVGPGGNGGEPLPRGANGAGQR